MNLGSRKRDKLREKLRGLDVFGQRIALTYRGEHTYKTNFGSCLTILLVIAISIYTGFGLKDVFMGRILSIS